MIDHLGRRSCLIGSALALSGVLLSQRVAAQSYPSCPAPAAGEYILLVRGESESERERALSVLPAANPVLVCSYVDDVVVRAGGFTNLEAANSWALYLTDVEDLDAFVAQPGSTGPATTAASAEPSVPPYQPQALGSGYAILIDYANQPEVAEALQQSIDRSVGLAIYRQRPYLLALATADAEAAAQLLQRLADEDYTAILVDSQQVVRLTSAVVLP
ncbi:MAG: hypothetical protein F6J97_18865 [Leptolyngbya sp. SIO4C1]|nr:hypothetical protein [Leptolyngbya sp. SIO4C1]